MTKSEYLEKLKSDFYPGPIPLELQDDKEVVIAALNIDLDLFQYASKRLKADKSVVKMACTLEYSTDTDLVNDLEFVREMIRINPDSLYYASNEIRDMEFIVLDAMRRGALLNCASKRLCDIKSLVLIAIESDLDSFDFVSKRLRSDPEIILKVLDTYGTISFDLDTKLFDTECFPALLYSKYPEIYNSHPTLLCYYRLRNNWPISFESFDKEYIDIKYWKEYMVELAYPEYYQEIPLEYYLGNENSIYFRCVKKFGSINPEFELNDELVFAALSNDEPIDHNVFGYIELNKMIFEDGSADYYDKKFLIDAVSLKREVFLALKGSCRKDLDIVKAAIKNDFSLVQYVHPDVKNSESFKEYIESLNQ